MQRYAIIDTNSGLVINVIEYEVAPPNPPPGFSDGIVAVKSAVAGPGWTWNGTSLVAPSSPIVAPLPQMVLPQELMAQFTASDIATITTAISSNSNMALMWYSLLAQKDAMLVANGRFQVGWSTLVAILGKTRMAVIAAALNITP